MRSCVDSIVWIRRILLRHFISPMVMYGIERQTLTTCFSFATHADFCVSESSRTRSGGSSTESDDNENGTVETRPHSIMPGCHPFKVVCLRGALDFGIHDIVDIRRAI
jgi:hypothetical protein